LRWLNLCLCLYSARLGPATVTFFDTRRRRDWPKPQAADLHGNFVGTLLPNLQPKQSAAVLERDGT
jgi:hypothetical protein